MEPDNREGQFALYTNDDNKVSRFCARPVTPNIQCSDDSIEYISESELLEHISRQSKKNWTSEKQVLIESNCRMATNNRVQDNSVKKHGDKSINRKEHWRSKRRSPILSDIQHCSYKKQKLYRHDSDTSIEMISLSDDDDFESKPTWSHSKTNNIHQLQTAKTGHIPSQQNNWLHATSLPIYSTKKSDSHQKGFNSSTKLSNKKPESNRILSPAQPKYCRRIFMVDSSDSSIDSPVKSPGYLDRKSITVSAETSILSSSISSSSTCNTTISTHDPVKVEKCNIGTNDLKVSPVNMLATSLDNSSNGGWRGQSRLKLRKQSNADITVQWQNQSERVSKAASKALSILQKSNTKSTNETPDVHNNAFVSSLQNSITNDEPTAKFDNRNNPSSMATKEIPRESGGINSMKSVTSTSKNPVGVFSNLKDVKNEFENRDADSEDIFQEVEVHFEDDSEEDDKKNVLLNKERSGDVFCASEIAKNSIVISDANKAHGETVPSQSTYSLEFIDLCQDEAGAVDGDDDKEALQLMLFGNLSQAIVNISDSSSSSDEEIPSDDFIAEDMTSLAAEAGHSCIVQSTDVSSGTNIVCDRFDNFLSVSGLDQISNERTRYDKMNASQVDHLEVNNLLSTETATFHENDAFTFQQNINQNEYVSRTKLENRKPLFESLQDGWNVVKAQLGLDTKPLAGHDGIKQERGDHAKNDKPAKELSERKAVKKNGDFEIKECFVLLKKLSPSDYPFKRIERKKAGKLVTKSDISSRAGGHGVDVTSAKLNLKERLKSTAMLPQPVKIGSAKSISMENKFVSEPNIQTTNKTVVSNKESRDQFKSNVSSKAKPGIKKHSHAIVPLVPSNDISRGIAQAKQQLKQRSTTAQRMSGNTEDLMEDNLLLSHENAVKDMQSSNKGVGRNYAGDSVTVDRKCLGNPDDQSTLDKRYPGGPLTHQSTSDRKYSGDTDHQSTFDRIYLGDTDRQLTFDRKYSRDTNHQSIFDRKYPSGPADQSTSGRKYSGDPILQPPSNQSLLDSILAKQSVTLEQVAPTSVSKETFKVYNEVDELVAAQHVNREEICPVPMNQKLVHGMSHSSSASFDQNKHLQNKNLYNEKYKLDANQKRTLNATPRDITFANHGHKNIVLPGNLLSSTISTKNSSRKSKYTNYEDELLKCILTWNVKWFAEQEEVSEPPPLCGNQYQFFSPPPTFTSYDDYYHIMFGLLVLEIWASLHRNWTANAKVESLVTFQPMSVNIQGKFLIFVLSGSDNQSWFPRERDIVILHVVTKPANNETSNVVKYLGYVSRSNCDKKGRACYNGKKDDMKTVCVTAIFRKIAIDDKASVKLEMVDSLVSDLRRYNALCDIHSSPLLPYLLNAPSTIVYQSLPPSLFCQHQSETCRRLTTSQLHAVNKLSYSVICEPDVPYIGLLQGPPGTGKSSTIVSLIGRLFEEAVKRQMMLRIMLCAPSNAAIDVLVRHLTDLKTFPEHITRKLNHRIVRIGSGDQVHPHVKQFCLDQLMETEYEQYLVKSLPASIQLSIEKLNALINEDAAKLRNLDSHRDEDKIRRLTREQEDRMRMKRQLMGLKNGGLRSKNRRHIQQLILNNAIIICSTLSGAYQLREIFVDRNVPSFSCIIIDEACQAVEVDTLIPLQYDCKKFFLIGDPKQLPATVLSKKAADLNFGQSLFERLVNHVKIQSSNAQRPVMMLDEQFRMSREIVNFPSSYFYGGQLKTHPSTVQRRAKFLFRPYVLFNILEGQEKQTSGGLIQNVYEEKFTVQLCEALLAGDSKMSSQLIGIITPYQRQRLAIQNQLFQRSTLRDIEVNTVDGFQGREKSVIIMSCVRARHESRSIGFLSDARRLNVAITRACYALYIVGHFDSLKVDENWRALIDDARRRECIVDICTSNKSIRSELINKLKHH